MQEVQLSRQLVWQHLLGGLAACRRYGFRASCQLVWQPLLGALAAKVQRSRGSWLPSHCWVVLSPAGGAVTWQWRDRSCSESFLEVCCCACSSKHGFQKRHRACAQLRPSSIAGQGMHDAAGPRHRHKRTALLPTWGRSAESHHSSYYSMTLNARTRQTHLRG